MVQKLPFEVKDQLPRLGPHDAMSDQMLRGALRSSGAIHLRDRIHVNNFSGQATGQDLLARQNRHPAGGLQLPRRQPRPRGEPRTALGAAGVAQKDTCRTLHDNG